MEFNDNIDLIKYELGNANMELFLNYEKELTLALKNNERRFWHSISVAITAVNLADIYGADKDECLISGLLHDYCKAMTLDELLLNCEMYNVNLSEEDKNADGCIHGFLAAKVCKEKFDISDSIYDAIYYHTCGRPNMTILEKIIYMSDFIEPLRRFRDKIEDVRKMCYENIDEAVYIATQMSINFLTAKGKFIHSNTIKTHEYYAKLLNHKI